MHAGCGIFSVSTTQFQGSSTDRIYDTLRALLQYVQHIQKVISYIQQVLVEYVFGKQSTLTVSCYRRLKLSVRHDPSLTIQIFSQKKHSRKLSKELSDPDTQILKVIRIPAYCSFELRHMLNTAHACDRFAIEAKP